MAAAPARQSRTTTERGLDRLVNFTDAAVAIAITFLVLPLVDVTGELDDGDLSELVGRHSGTILAFVITFAVIGRLWMVHNRVFEWVQDYDSALVWTNFLWLASIVALPFAANVLSYADHDRGVYALYIGTMIVASGSTLLMEKSLLRTPGLLRERAPAAAALPASWATLLLLVAALVVAVVFPAVNMLALLLLLLNRPVEALLRRGAPAPAADSHTARGLNRLVNFSDATVAIAITILVLPVVELAPEIAKPDADLASLIADDWSTFLAFGLSFAVIAVFWVPHHRMFELVGDYDAVLVWVNLLWLCGVAFFPFATSVVAEAGDTPSTHGLYIGTMIVMSGGLVLIDVVLILRPQLRRDPATPVDIRLALLPFGLLVVAFVLALVAPAVGLWSLVLLALQRPLGALLDRALPRR